MRLSILLFTLLCFSVLFSQKVDYKDLKFHRVTHSEFNRAGCFAFLNGEKFSGVATKEVKKQSMETPYIEYYPFEEGQLNGRFYSLLENGDTLNSVMCHYGSKEGKSYEFIPKSNKIKYAYWSGSYEDSSYTYSEGELITVITNEKINDSSKLYKKFNVSSSVRLLVHSSEFSYHPSTDDWILKSWFGYRRPKPILYYSYRKQGIENIFDHRTLKLSVQKIHKFRIYRPTALVLKETYYDDNGNIVKEVSNNDNTEYLNCLNSHEYNLYLNELDGDHTQGLKPGVLRIVVGGVLKDKNGNPIENATLTLIDKEDYGYQIKVKTLKGGRFSFLIDKSASYSLDVNAPGQGLFLFDLEILPGAVSIGANRSASFSINLNGKNQFKKVSFDGFRYVYY